MSTKITLNDAMPREPFKLVLKGYLPPSQNSLKGSHWSALYHEKQRAAHALRLCLQSTLSDPQIGTTPTQRSCKTCLSMLESYMMTVGAFSKAGSSRQRRTTERKKGRK